ncbi:hypothetical protein INR75_11260 [Zunongwangia sp. SCSIO 43204]|uniref:hypothetical protein n=1 Tax=Zunongwangia sp. SCSIO 43204 TaxID=2779359 RepID=UPI001CAA31E5|nr:hypothetical protein [Zunongwangia sp. SCSIO 43204]UAB82813.1 hypothetical protein INR75_11260 [Zunongwangia sp. SCSIO 43204]
MHNKFKLSGIVFIIIGALLIYLEIGGGMFFLLYGLLIGMGLGLFISGKNPLARLKAKQ